MSYPKNYEVQCWNCEDVDECNGKEFWELGI